ncbi:MAG: hypothetical protein JEZ04_21695 [Spirochaetales bacterium]|nr:hypothetical protein [Spirochaetales bacterium]
MSKEISVNKVFIAAILTSALLVFITWLLGGRLDTIPHPVDEGAHWYYWQLGSPTVASRLSAWLGYGLHQMFIWVVLFKAKNEKPHPETVSRFNIAVLLINLVFIILHLVQTHIWYDGLAQDVPIWTSQGSVIVMLVLMLVMLTPRRGFILGRKISLPENGKRFLAAFHGIFISWALVYTFWFHPMEGTYGLLSGFFYMYLLFIQLSLFNTKIHFNMKWLILLETMVAVHGTLITLQKENPIWPMFLSGFLFMFVFTYVYGLTKKRSLRIATLILYVISIAAMYYFRGFDKLYEVSFIPVALYGGGLALILLLKLFVKDKKSQ